MPRLTRIEKSAFRKGEYVGYANGVWLIQRSDAGWTARHREAAAPRITARTLADLDAKLTMVAEGV
jgi:translation elongation factor P/translation initiation factor 5A